MTQDRKYLISGVVAIIVLVIGVGFLVKRFYKQVLPDGKVSQDTNAEVKSLTTSMDQNIKPQVKIVTSKGEFVIELRSDLAPKTVANFLAKFADGYCNNLTWHRVEDWVVQGCDPAGNGTGGKSDLTTETSDEPFVAGSVGVARKTFPKEYSNDSQFFILKKDSAFLNSEYTYFGRVISGMDVVNRITVGDLIIDTTILSK